MYLLDSVLEDVPSHPFALEHARDCGGVGELVVACIILGQCVDGKAKVCIAVRQVAGEDIRRQGQANVVAILKDHLD